MAGKGYTTPDNVARQLGRTLTDAQLTHLDDLVIPAAEQWIDMIGGRTYGDTAVVAEQLYFASPVTLLSKTPISTLSAVRGYMWGQSISDLAVVPNYRYLLQDKRIGQIYLPDWNVYQYLEADYVPDSTIPDNIKLATTIVCGVFMRSVLHPQTEWLAEYASGQDVRLKFRTLDMPQMVYDLIGSGSGGIVVA